MTLRQEAVLWSIAITAAIVLGLTVVWAAIALAFSQPNLAPLYFAAAPYRQDDYSAEDVNLVRLNPLDPNLEQEALREDQARSSLVPQANPLELVVSAMSTVAPPTLTPRPVLATTAVPAPLNTLPSVPTQTATPIPGNTPRSSATFQPSNTAKPNNTPKPSHTPKPANTRKPIDTPLPVDTPLPNNTPKPDNTHKPLKP
jgi:hypothetical protein